MGYTCGIKDLDVVIVGRQRQDVVGAVRLCNEKGVLVMRGMYVAEALRGSGIGKSLLYSASKEIGNRECWCVPYRHLSDFYSTAGFAECSPSEAPTFLAERNRNYIAAGMDVILMKRSKSFCDGDC
jgi:predicted N-acetyltransferase YhbS